MLYDLTHNNLKAYRPVCTHLIIPEVLSSEKFLATCAAGKS